MAVVAVQQDAYTVDKVDENVEVCTELVQGILEQPIGLLLNTATRTATSMYIKLNVSSIVVCVW